MTEKCEPPPYPEWGWWRGLSQVQVIETVLCREHAMMASSARDAGINILRAMEEAFPPNTPPATVAALVEALEAAVLDMEQARDSTGMGNDGPLERARAALNAYRGNADV